MSVVAPPKARVPDHTRRRRLGTVAQGVTTMVLLVLVAITALVVKPPQPPGIAEFAPQAARPITKAPQQQSATNGNAPGACFDESCASPSASPRPAAAIAGDLIKKGVPSALQCYTWPDGSVTQTFDPQSPPCVPNWPDADRGNGGATATGVSATSVRVVVPTAYSNQPARFKVLTDFFNAHFQLYGRKIVLEHLDSTKFYNGTTAGESDPSSQKAMAVGARALKPFASTGLSNLNTYSPGVYVNAMSDYGIVTSTSRAGSTTSQELRAHPYAFTYNAPSDVMERNLAEMLCTSIPAKGAAAYAGNGTQGKPRKWGALLPDASGVQGGLPDTKIDALIRGLAACGVKIETFRYAFGAGLQATSANSQLAASLKANNFTSLVFFGSSAAANTGMYSASQAASYQPEWILPGTIEQDTTTSTNSAQAPASQTSHMYGIGHFSKTLSATGQPWALAYKEMSGAYADGGFNQLQAFYHEMQMIASGIQAAGPRLTPATFTTALETLEFPNPGGGEAPSFQATVGFKPGEHWMTRDFGAWWYSTNTVAEEEGGLLPGKMCLVRRGLRWSEGTWPKAPLPLFSGPCNT